MLNNLLKNNRSRLKNTSAIPLIIFAKDFWNFTKVSKFGQIWSQRLSALYPVHFFFLERFCVNIRNHLLKCAIIEDNTVVKMSYHRAHKFNQN